MDILSIVVLIIAIVKKDKRCLPVCILSFLYSVSYTIFVFPTMQETVFYDVFRTINVPFLAIVLVVSVLTFRKPFENGKRYILPIIFNGGALVVRIIRKVFYYTQGLQIKADGADIQSEYNVLVLGCTILDVLFSCAFLGIMICLIVILRRKRVEISP